MSRSLLILLVLSGCGFAGADMSDEVLGQNLAPSTAARVEAVTLHKTRAQVSMSIPGEVVGSQDALLAAGNGGTVDRVLVDRGSTIRKGQSIARVGSSGNVDRPQLHFEVRRGTKAVNPETQLAPRTASASN